jgi:hypothetical protein
MTPLEFWWLFTDDEDDEPTLENPGITRDKVEEMMRKFPDGDNS